ncbi:type IV secretory system conjugative DNA transfer family protein [Vibrio rotiferianus]|uniref:type IV secretory system conjugative DNA transfer family protein n=2 Tax=Vibrio rotiferianus TaxID=190895 RepID=UPI0003A166F7|nr:type IV secretory system conjugative DNA transfer family protein [Vibrio rotiferianus]
MIDSIMFSLAMVVAEYTVFCIAWGWLLSIACGLFLAAVLRMDEEKNNPVTIYFIRTVFAVLLMAGPLGPIVNQYLFNAFSYGLVYEKRLILSSQPWYLALVAVGVALFFAGGRYLLPRLDSLRDRVMRRTSLERNKRTDIRTVDQLLPNNEENYLPVEYFDFNKGVFVGMDSDGKPQYIPKDVYQKKHAQLIGSSGAGKGRAAQMLLAQSIGLDEAVFVLDPKDDEWCRHVLKKSCEDNDKPFYLFDLRSNEYQIDMLAGITQYELEELMTAGFGLEKTGSDADFHKGNDRRASRVFAGEINNGPQTFRSMFQSPLAEQFKDGAAGFMTSLEEIALVNSVNALGGFDLREIFESGGCVYIVGSSMNEQTKIVQKMLVQRIFQIAASRDRTQGENRPVAVFLDEFKYHISRITLAGLGLVRDKGVHLILAFQAISDLADCGALEVEAVEGAVMENCKLMIAYAIEHPETRTWLAQKTGKILIDDEVRKTKASAVFTESMDVERSVRQAERFLVDENMLQGLPSNVGYFFGASSMPFTTFIDRYLVEKTHIDLCTVSSEGQQDINPLAALERKKGKKSKAVEESEDNPLAGLDEGPEDAEDEPENEPLTTEPIGQEAFNEAIDNPLAGLEKL